MRGSGRRVARGDDRGFARAGSGQATVEGAFLIPVILLLLMLLIQPGIILYDRMVMGAAAAEGCRLLATKTSALEGVDEACDLLIRRRLGAVPQQENFHVHEAGCSWVIELTGDEGSSRVGVSVETQIKPLPLFDFGASALGLTNGAGNFVQRVEVTQPVRGTWVASNELGLDPRAWVAQDGSAAEGGA